MRKSFIVVGVMIFALVGYLAFTVVDGKTPVATAGKKTYSGTVYVAGMGGHFAKADITIDPNNADNPIKVAGLDRVVIGDKNTHPTHDARIDVNDPNIMFWSTYKIDPNGKQHVGKTDLRTGNVIKDVAMAPDPRSTGGEKKMPLYCASGQTKKYFMPV